MNRQEWLDGLKVGDEVAIPLSFSGQHFRLERIRGETPTQWKIGSYGRYRKSDGKRIACSRHEAHLFKEPTESIRTVIRHEQACSRLTEIVNRGGLTKVSAERIEEVIAALSEEPSE